MENCRHEGLKALPETLSRRLNVDVKVRKGRFAEEYNIDLYRGDARILTIKVFCGRGLYRGWIEIFDVNGMLFSEVEGELYKIAYELLKPGEPIYVEYSWDAETVKLIDMGMPPEVTRIGSNLLAAGFTWFKVWYYPEGFMEGNVKIQAEKAVDEEARERHILDICSSLKSLTLVNPRIGEVEVALKRALSLMEALRCP